MKQQSNTKAIAAALSAMLCVQGGASIAKSLFPVLGPTGTTTLRIGLSAILLNIIIRPKISTFTKKEWKYAFFYGGSIALMNLIFYMAIQRIPLGLGVTIEFIGPLFLALYFSKKPLDILWALFACVGILLIVPWNSSNVDIVGLGLAFLAGTFWACYIVMGSKVSREMDTKNALAVGMFFATMIIIPVVVYTGELKNLTTSTFFLGLAVAVLSSALPFSLDLVALRKLPAKTFSILTSLQPAFAALSGLIFLHEQLSMLQWISIFCVITASLGTTIFSQKE